jgi:hypothetical protein
VNIPTHIVIDTRDGWTWARDRDGNPFTEETATTFYHQMNDDSRFDHRTYIMAAVTPVMSKELMAAVIRDNQETAPQIEQGESVNYASSDDLEAALTSEQHPVTADQAKAEAQRIHGGPRYEARETSHGTWGVYDTILDDWVQFLVTSDVDLTDKFWAEDWADEHNWDISNQHYGGDQSDGTRADND